MTIKCCDVSGNQLAVYEFSDNDTLLLKEFGIYGSSRVVLLRENDSIVGTGFVSDTVADAWLLALGDKVYEQTNHDSTTLTTGLRNVMSTITDKPIAVDIATPIGVIDYFDPDYVTAQDYYPFGMLMPERHVEAGDSCYRFGFNSQERVNEISGLGNHYSAEYWEYDVRLGRRWNVDPLTHLYTSQSPYSVNNNSPIGILDKKGAGGVVSSVEENEEGEKTATIKATIYIYKNAKEQTDLKAFATILENSLNEQFNSANGKIKVIDPKTKRAVTALAKFEFKVEVLDQAPEDIAESVKGNTKKSNNYFAVYTNENNGTDETAQGGNSGFLQVNAKQNTWAHEILHSFNWDEVGSDNGHSRDPASIMYHTVSPMSKVGAKDIANLNYLNGTLKRKVGFGLNVKNYIYGNPPDRTPINSGN